MFPSHDFNEIMPTIFRRFVEKEAHDWRQIYKVRHTHTHTHISKNVASFHPTTMI